MKNILLSLLLFICTKIASAQNPDQALLRVKYDLRHVRDTTNKTNLYKETMVLVVGKNASMFLSYDKILRNIAAKAAFEQQIKEQAGNITAIKSPPRTRTYTGNELYYYANENKLYNLEAMGTTYLTEETPEKIAWKITKDTLNIEGINCKKALATYKGRNWVAWFAEELPFTSGPWKLVGLPGLILKAHDDKNEVSFDFAGMEKVDHNEKTTEASLDQYQLKKLGRSDVLQSKEIVLPTNAVKTSVKDLDRLKETRLKDPQGFAKTQLADIGMGGITPISSGSTVAKNPTTSNNTFNNPIEKTTVNTNK